MRKWCTAWQFLIRIHFISFSVFSSGSHIVNAQLTSRYMNLFSSEYNKRINLFEQGVSRIRNKNNNFFENTRNKSSIYDLKDIKSYFSLDFGGETPLIQFRQTNALPQAIQDDLVALFQRVWIA